MQMGAGGGGGGGGGVRLREPARFRLAALLPAGILYFILYDVIIIIIINNYNYNPVKSAHE